MEEVDPRMAALEALDVLRHAGGSRAGDAWPTLVDLGPAIDPILVNVFRKENDARLRAVLVEVVWRHRDPDCVPFLAEALEDAEADVWKQALYGLVAIGGPVALGALRAAAGRDRSSAGSGRERLSWIEEAIGRAGGLREGEG